MAHSLKYQKERMARMGYYLVADYAALTSVSRQAVHVKVKEKSIDSLRLFNRDWIKFDNGEHSIMVYGNTQNTLSEFLNFGFNQRLKSLIVSDKVVCDIKHLRDNSVSIRFYNQSGDMLSIIADLSTIEIINDVSDIV